jgi:hypothetical protein
MAALVGYLDPALDSPGFLLPLFQKAAGANLDLTQVVGSEDEVLDFREIAPPVQLVRRVLSRASVEVGAPALWAFKDHLGEVHLGDASQMGPIAAKLLQDAGLLPWPLVRLELSSFRDRLTDPEMLQAAFASVGDDSGDRAAQVWRDTEVFAPALRRDAGRSRRDLLHATSAGRMIVLFGERLNVFADPRTLSHLKAVELEETRHALNAFGLPPEVRFRSLGELERRDTRPSIWRIRGVGGVAHHVLKARPFAGRPYLVSSRPTDRGIQADGPIQADLTGGTPASQFIAVCQSVVGQVEAMAAEVATHPPELFVRHLVNVRPFSFGSPPPRKTGVEQLPLVARNFDHVWIIAGHRQRWTGSYRNQLSVSNAASRLVRNLLVSLLRRADLVSRITHDGMAAVPSLNLFGTLRPRAEWSETAAVQNLLHTMLCEEASLHTADRIVVLAPGSMRARKIDAHLGERKYLVEIYPDPRPRRSSEIIGWALSVKLPKDRTQDFADLCIGLLAGYGWVYRGPDGEALLFEDEGEALRVWPAQSPRVVLKLISAPAPYGRYGDVILTPHTIPRDWLRRAEDMEWALLHYSALPRWLRDNFRSGRFGDLEDE